MKYGKMQTEENKQPRTNETTIHVNQEQIQCVMNTYKNRNSNQ